jgi:hypothetical protein
LLVGRLARLLEHDFLFFFYICFSDGNSIEKLLDRKNIMLWPKPESMLVFAADRCRSNSVAVPTPCDCEVAPSSQEEHGRRHSATVRHSAEQEQLAKGVR